MMGKYNLGDALARLKERARDAEEKAESLSEDLVAGRIEPKDFLAKYVPLRQAYHEDTVRAEIVEPALASRRPGGDLRSHRLRLRGHAPAASRYGGM